MRNVDKIKALEKDLGRYQKKVADQAKELRRLKEALEAADIGNQQTQATVDAVLTAVTLHHGEIAYDPDDQTRELGWRLSVPLFSVQDVRSRYEIHARRDEDAGVYVLGVTARAEVAE